MTWAHHALLIRAKKHTLVALILTIILAFLFTVYWWRGKYIMKKIFNENENESIERAPQIKAKYFFVAGVAAFWQISFHDPASISMEGILMLNKHLSMLIIVIVIVLLVGWFLLSVVSYFIGCCGIKIAPNPKGDDTGKSCQPRVDTRKLGPHKPVAKILPS